MAEKEQITLDKARKFANAHTEIFAVILTIPLAVVLFFAASILFNWFEAATTDADKFRLWLEIGWYLSLIVVIQRLLVRFYYKYVLGYTKFPRDDF